jgi:hypothetical protein
VENPIYTGERRDARDAARANKELAVDAQRDNTRMRVDQQASEAQMRADSRAAEERGRNERAAMLGSLRQSLAAQAGDRRRDALYARVDKEDEAAYRTAEKDADKDYKGALAERGDKALSSKEMSDLQTTVTRVRTLGGLAARLGEGSVGPRGPLGGLGAAEEVKAVLARESPLLRKALGKDQEFADSWWADYRAEFENLERNKLFGSALTKSETELWNKSNLSRGLPDSEIRRRIAERVGISNAVLARMTQGQAANKKNVDAIQETTEGFYTAPPKPTPADPASRLPADRRSRLYERGVIGPTGGERTTGSVSPNFAPPPKKTTTPDGWSVEEVK